MQSSDRERVLTSWVKPSSDTEKDQQDRAERMVREAIKRRPPFSGVDYKIYTKGSYPNNTNVRSDSDVDVVVECHEVFFYDYESGVTGNPSLNNPYKGEWTAQRWRQEVGDAVADAFGASDVDRTGKVAINVAAIHGSRPSADVVPSFDYRRFLDSQRRNSHDGSCVFDATGTKIVNWPNQQLLNGQAKNSRTGNRYKRFVRALKRAENVLAEAGTIAELPSYFMECLVWNVANPTLTSGNTLDAGFRATLAELWTGLDGNAADHWSEPNDLKWLFRGQQNWSVADGKKLVWETYNYLGYE